LAEAEASAPSSHSPRLKRVRITRGTIVDATILHAPSSTKNREQQRDPEMHQTKKGDAWYFGMKAHVGVDSKTKIIHTAVATAANVADSTVLSDLLHGPLPLCREKPD
jgi:transposase, IS5 family